MGYYVDPDRCIACGLCTQLAEGVFEMTDAGVAQVVSQPGAEQAAAAKTALESCPVEAIRVE